MHKTTTPEWSQPALFDELGRWHRGDPDTSRRAALDNYVRSGTQRARVLIALARAGDRGATDYELWLRCGCARPHVAGTRRKELAERGLVARTDRTRPTDTGSQATVWEATEAGRQAAAALEKKGHP